MTEPAEYTGRFVDISVIDSDNFQKLRRARTSMFDETRPSGEVVTGALRVAQDFLTRLLTIQGSVRGDEDYGCLFMQQLRNNEFRTPVDVSAAFNAAELELSAQLQAAEESTDTADERYDSAELRNVDITYGSIRLTIAVQTLAGNERVAILPLSIGV